MAWCLLTPSHFLKQCWLNINTVWWSSTWGYHLRMQWRYMYQSMPCECLYLKSELHVYLPGANELMNVIMFRELCQTRFICQVHMPMDQSIRGLILHVFIYFEKQCKCFFLHCLWLGCDAVSWNWFSLKERPTYWVCCMCAVVCSTKGQTPKTKRHNSSPLWMSYGVSVWGIWKIHCVAMEPCWMYCLIRPIWHHINLVFYSRKNISVTFVYFCDQDLVKKSLSYHFWGAKFPQYHYK